MVVSEGSAKAAASQAILPVQQAVLPFDCTTLAAAYVTCVDVQEDVCSVIAGTNPEVSVTTVQSLSYMHLELELALTPQLLLY